MCCISSSDALTSIMGTASTSRLTETFLSVCAINLMPEVSFKIRNFLKLITALKKLGENVGLDVLIDESKRLKPP